VGFKNSGKTSIGKLIAESDVERNNTLFIDTDNLIEIEYFNNYKQNLTVREIYKTKGEFYFRSLEKKIVKSLNLNFGLNTKHNFIIATGGGVVLEPENLVYLKTWGKVIYLYLSYDALMQRSVNQTIPAFINGSSRSSRSSRSGGLSLLEIYEQRKDIYKNLADITINVENKINSTIAQEILLYGK
jgi:shikimate kinase